MTRPLSHNFCVSCGTALAEGSCPQCDFPGAVAATGDSRGSLLFKNSFVLYFTLLATFIPFAFDRELIVLEIIVSVLDAFIVLFFSIRFWPAIRPLFILPRWYWWCIAAAATVVIFAINTAYIRLIVGYLNVPYIGLRTEAYLDFGMHWWAVIALVCLQPGIFEELAFRGLIFEGLSRHLSYRETWILSVFMFAILHLSLWSFPAIFFIGSALVVLRQRSGSLFPGMAMHASYNFLCIVWDLLYPV